MKALAFAAAYLCFISCGSFGAKGDNKADETQRTGQKTQNGTQTAKLVAAEVDTKNARKVVEEFMRLLSEATLMDHDTPESTIGQNLSGTVSAEFASRLNVTVKEVRSTLEGSETYSKYYLPMPVMLGGIGMTSVANVFSGYLAHTPLGKVRLEDNKLFVPTCVIASEFNGRVRHRRLQGAVPTPPEFKQIPRNSSYVRFVVIKNAAGKYVVDSVQRPEGGRIPCIAQTVADTSKVSAALRDNAAQRFMQLASDDGSQPQSVDDPRAKEIADGPALRYFQEHALMSEFYRAQFTKAYSPSKLKVTGTKVMFDKPVDLTMWGQDLPKRKFDDVDNLSPAEILRDFGPGLRSLGVCVSTDVFRGNESESVRSAVLMIMAYDGSTWRVAAATNKGMLKDSKLGKLPAETEQFIEGCEKSTV